MTRTRLYRDGAVVEENFPASEASERLGADEHAVAWLDLCRPAPDDLDLLAQEFGLHRLAVEAAVKQQHRAKLDRYDDEHQFLSAYMVRLPPEGGLICSAISAFITPRALITVRMDDGFDIDELVARWDEHADLAEHGVAFLLYGLLDVLVDTYFVAVQQLDASIDSIEDLLFDEKSNPLEVQHRSFDTRHDLVRLRQVLLPMRAAVNAVMRPALRVVDPAMIPYYEDVYDHALRAVEWTDALRDLVATLLETNLTVQSNRQNVMMKKVTSWAAIIAVPTAITSFYGQNLPIPGENKLVGLILSTTTSLGIASLLYLLFRRKDWL